MCRGARTGHGAGPRESSPAGPERPGVAYQRSPAAPDSAPSMARASFASASSWQASQYGLSALPSTLPRSQPRQSIGVDRKGPEANRRVTPLNPRAERLRGCGWRAGLPLGVYDCVTQSFLELATVHRAFRVVDVNGHPSDQSIDHLLLSGALGEFASVDLNLDHLILSPLNPRTRLGRTGVGV